jgi:hypothetical protein
MGRVVASASAAIIEAFSASRRHPIVLQILEGKKREKNSSPISFLPRKLLCDFFPKITGLA